MHFLSRTLSTNHLVIQGCTIWAVDSLLNRPWIGAKKDPKQRYSRITKPVAKWEDCQDCVWIWCRMLHCRRVIQHWPRSCPILRSVPRLGVRAPNGNRRNCLISVFEHSHGFPLNTIPPFFFFFVLAWTKRLLLLFILIYSVGNLLMKLCTDEAVSLLKYQMPECWL